MKIGIIGTGAMACFYAHRFASAQHNVSIIGSWDKQIQAVNDKGIALVEIDGTSSVQRVRAEYMGADSADYDLIFVITKANKTAAAAQWLTKFKNGIVISIQNGLGNLHELQSVNPALHIVAAATTQGARIVKETVVENTGDGITHFAQSELDAATQEILENVFQHSKLQYKIHENADSVIWGKLLVNAGINALTAVLDVNNGFLTENEIAKKTMQLLASEVAEVTQKAGIVLPFENPAEQLMKVCAATASNTSSMRADVLRGAATEIEYINGAVVKKAKEMHLDASANVFLVEMVQQIEKGEILPGLHNLALLEKFLQSRNS